MTTPRRPRRPRPTAPMQQAVAREAKDILLKRLAGGLGGGFPAALGLDLAPIVAALPAELPVLSVRAEQPDNLFRLADADIAQFEFQMKRNADDLERFYRTQFAVAEHYQCPVHTVVLYGPDVLEAPDTLDRGSAVFRVRNVYIGAMDGEAVVAMLRERLAAGQPLSEAEGTWIKLLPLMRQRRELSEVLREVALLARGLPRAEREEILGTMVGLTYNYPRARDERTVAGGVADGQRAGEPDRGHAGARAHRGQAKGAARAGPKGARRGCAIWCAALSIDASVSRQPRWNGGSPPQTSARWPACWTDCRVPIGPTTCSATDPAHAGTG